MESPALRPPHPYLHTNKGVSLTFTMHYTTLGLEGHERTCLDPAREHDEGDYIRLLLRLFVRLCHTREEQVEFSTREKRMLRTSMFSAVFVIE